MPDKRRDKRLMVGLPFAMSEIEGAKRWECVTVDASPTGLLLEIKDEAAPAIGTVVNVAVQGPTEDAWEHINVRPMRIVRVQDQLVGLTYEDLD